MAQPMRLCRFRKGSAEIPNATILLALEGTHYCVLTQLELTRPAMMVFLTENQ